MACFLPVELVIACEFYYVQALDLLAGFALQLDDKVWRLSMEMANVDRGSLADLDLLLLQTVDLSYRERNKMRDL